MGYSHESWDDVDTKPILAKNDPREIQKFYQWYYENYVKDGPVKRKPEEMAKHYQIASVLYDVLKTVVPSERVDDEINRYAKEVEKKRFTMHTITFFLFMVLVLHLQLWSFQRSKQQSMYYAKWIIFPGPKYRQLRTPNRMLMAPSCLIDLFMICWTGLGWLLVSRFPSNAETQQLELLYLVLYFLIWGEASNIRFMPECLCYIFHNMAKELHGILFGNVHVVSGVEFEPAYQGEESFLREVATPIYQVLRKEVLRNKGGTASHSRWRNYDDLNEYFWSNDCFKLGWPMNRESDFFIHSEEMHSKTEHLEQVVTGRRKPKTNFVEVRTFWHLFRSFDRMWIFFAMAFQAMLIVAWSPSRSLAAFFDADVFKSIMSIFITSAILNFFQGAVVPSILVCFVYSSPLWSFSNAN